MDKTIGERVKEVMAGRGISACKLASMIPCERSNVYNIFRRPNISVDLLMRLCVVLEHDFFKELSDEYVRERRKCADSGSEERQVV